MIFSKTCEYALQAMIYLAVVQKKVGIAEISEQQELPSHYLSKILQSLVKAKIIQSAKGPTGGFWLSRPADKVPLTDIIEAIDGLESLEQCGLGLKKCDSDHPCAIHHSFKPHREAILELFYMTTLADIITRFEAGDCVLNLKHLDPSDLND
jgi:Rrf2 family protein